MKSSKNKLIIAAAGSGKTTFLVQEALRHSGAKILITTYTEANEAEIRKQFIAACGCIPGHVKIQTWFSFLIQHGVKPFQGRVLPDVDVKGLLLANTQSARMTPEAWARRYYLSSGSKIYSDKLSKLVIRCNERSGGQVIERLTCFFSHIFIDEVQDLAGYDLEVVKALFSSTATVVLVGDPRQVVYLTHHEAKYKKYSDGKIREFVDAECAGLEVEIDDEMLAVSYRSNRFICEVSDRLYPTMKATTSKQDLVTAHDGVFLVQKQDVRRYLESYQPIQLRLTRNVTVDASCPAYTFGESKGLSFDRVMIYPTKDMVSWTLDTSTALADMTRARFYVGLTRARHSVAIICEKVKTIPGHVSLWQACVASGGKVADS